MNFVFEKDESNLLLNFTNCKDLNSSGIPRFTVSPLITELVQLQANSKVNLKILTKIPKYEKYIIPSGVAHSPDFWTGKFEKTPSKKTVFECLTPRYLKDLQLQTAYLLLDQSHEGYHELWLWDWFHDECKKFNISPNQIIYVTGNLRSKEQYLEWCKSNTVEGVMNIIPYAHFELAISKMTTDKTPNVKTHINYKRLNADNIKLYNCLQKRPRNHRVWLFKNLNDNKLLDDGINTMNVFDKLKSFMEGRTISEEEYQELVKKLPLLPSADNELEEFSSDDCGKYLTLFNEDIMLDSWISIISEASFTDSSNTCFLSEKIFKPIACEHPFIVYGNRDSLAYLRSLGYKTFHPFINEKYDSLPTWDRLDEIIKEVKRISLFSFKEKVRWYKGMSSILEHNKQNLLLREKKSLNILKNLRDIVQVKNV